MTEEKKKEIKMEDVRVKAEEKKCPVQKTLSFIDEFLAGPMCGKCFPCSFGSYEARIRIKRLASSSASENDIDSLKRIASNMLEASMCKKGKDTAKYIAENIDLNEFKEHLAQVCSSKECIDLYKYVVIPEKCTMCDICKEVCKYNAIIGEKKRPFHSGYLPFEIIQPRCTKCGDCIKVCPEGAIIMVDVKDREPVGV